MQLPGMNVMVTGGAGFIGSHLVEALLAEGAEVTVLDNSCQGSPENLATSLASIEYLRADVLAPEAQHVIATRQFDLIYHLASNSSVPSSVEDPGADLSLNLLGTFRLLETIRLTSPGTSVIYFSSAAVYGCPKDVPIDETAPLAPISPHGVSKLAADRYVSVYSHLYGLKAAILRIFSAYGPRLRKQVVYDLIKKVHDDHRELHLLGDGSQIRDFCYVDDVVNAALIAAARGRLEGEVYHVASGTGCSTKDLAKLICDVIGVSPRFIFSGAVRPGDPQEWVADITKLRGLGYSPQIDLPEGIARTCHWFKHSIHASALGDCGRPASDQVENGVNPR